MSSSYFDAQPEKATPPAARLYIPEGSDLAKTGLLSPQVSRILDDLELEEKSSSDDDSDPDKDTSRDRKSRRDLAEDHRRKNQTSPLPRGNKRVPVQNQPPSPRPGVNSPKQPHFARFHSLRSMLFSSHIEDNIKRCNESKMQEQAEAKWRAEHNLRRGLNRPKTPEKQSPPREGLGRRVKARLKRMTSKDSPPPTAKIIEDNVSTASDDEEEEAYHSDEENIDHSDIEDLVRWVSRRDPPSDGEARKLKGGDVKQISKTDSGHESLGQSDVEELVRWVSYKDEPQSKAWNKNHAPPAVTAQHGYSDASTESDSEENTHKSCHRESMDENDVNELVRWVSRKDGPDAGPVRKKNGSTGTGTPSGSEAQDAYGDDLVRWVTKRDGTSGESLNASQESLPIITEHKKEPKTASKAGSKLKREVSNTKPASKPAAMESDGALTGNDVDELVQWVTRKNAEI